jgi:predicted Zn-dependent peptidase
MLALEDTMDHMLWIGESVSALDKAYSLQEIVKETEKVSLGDIREAARLVFKQENLNLALIGPVKEAEGEISQRLYLG